MCMGIHLENDPYICEHFTDLSPLLLILKTICVKGQALFFTLWRLENQKTYLGSLCC